MRPILACLVASAVCVSAAAAQESNPHDRLARDLLAELIAIDTTDATGNITTAAEAMAARLKAAGFADADVTVAGPNDRKRNLVARLRGRGTGRPILLLAHLDVVGARKEDWSADLDPFRLVERDGYFYGRGTSDDKGQAAIWIANLIRYRQEGVVPDRDVIVALTADEEGGTANGPDWLLKNRRDLIDAEFCLNEGGGGELKNGRHVANSVQAAEKVYHSLALEVRNPGGHSSLPRKDHAIYQLAAALSRLAAHQFPVALNDVTRGFFAKMADLEAAADRAADLRAVAQPAPDLAAARRLSEASPLYNSMMRTTCVVTQVQGGEAENALPQSARAVVNCRILPGVDPDDVERTLKAVIADDGIAMKTLWRGVSSPVSPLRADVMAAVERHTKELWPEAAVLPVMSTGATDAVYLRNAGIPTYGVEGIFSPADDVRAHGRDERVGVKEFYEGREFLYRVVKTLAGVGVQEVRK